MNAENERRLKICNFKNLTRKKKLIFKPVEKNFLNNFKLLTSKYIYSQFLLNFKIITKLSYAYSIEEEKEIFYNLHRYNIFSNILLVNYKILLNALPLNKKFNNRYDKKCYLCNSVVDEDIPHLFVTCKTSNKCFDFIKSFFDSNNIALHLDLVQYKFNLTENNYRILSIYVFSVWQTRNILKHSKEIVDAFNIFKNIFNKWFLSKTSI